VSDKENTVGKDKDINWRRARFVSEFCANGGNATEAAIAAGYSARSARQQGSRLLTNDDIQAEIQAHKTALQVQSGRDSGWLMVKLEVEATDPNSSPSERIRALEVMGRVMGAYAPEKRQVEAVSSGFFADLTPEDDLPENVLPFKSETCGD
jgi:phage terminase small subunit